MPSMCRLVSGSASSPRPLLAPLQAPRSTAPSAQHHHQHSSTTSTASPAQLHRHGITSTAPPAQLHHQHSSITSIAVPAQHHQHNSTTSTASSPAQHHQHIPISPAPPPAQLRPAPRPSAPPGPEPPLPGAQRGGSAGRQRQQPRPCIIHPAEEMSPPAGGVSPPLPRRRHGAPRGFAPPRTPLGTPLPTGDRGWRRGLREGMPNFSA